MGLFDQISSAIGGLAGHQGTSGNPLLAAVMQMISNPQTGGLSGLVNAFRQRGLGQVADSWVSTGPNLPISAEQIRDALGGDRVHSLASQAGVTDDQASGQLAQFLPQMVDRLTPDGRVPEGNDLMDRGLELLKGRLFG